MCDRPGRILQDRRQLPLMPFRFEAEMVSSARPSCTGWVAQSTSGTDGEEEPSRDEQIVKGQLMVY